MVPRWLFRMVQNLLLVLKVLYWQLFVVFVTVNQMFGMKDYRPKLNKTPTRVALCVEMDKNKLKRNPKSRSKEMEALVDKCALAATWCYDAGVDDVTIFESSGVLSEKKDLFKKQLEKNVIKKPLIPNLVFGKMSRVQKVEVYENGNTEPSFCVECCSAEEATEVVSVRFLCDEDSERDLARVAQELVDEKDVKTDRITENLLNGRLSSSRGNKEKLNVILTYSISPNLLGFPPWLMRTPEILNLGESIVQASYASFVWAMFKYSKTEQRWGR